MCIAAILLREIISGITIAVLSFHRECAHLGLAYHIFAHACPMHACPMLPLEFDTRMPPFDAITISPPDEDSSREPAVPSVACPKLHSSGPMTPELERASIFFNITYMEQCAAGLALRVSVEQIWSLVQDAGTAMCSTRLWSAPLCVDCARLSWLTQQAARSSQQRYR